MEVGPSMPTYIRQFFEDNPTKLTPVEVWEWQLKQQRTCLDQRRGLDAKYEQIKKDIQKTMHQTKMVDKRIAEELALSAKLHQAIAKAKKGGAGPRLKNQSLHRSLGALDITCDSKSSTINNTNELFAQATSSLQRPSAVPAKPSSSHQMSIEAKIRHQQMQQAIPPKAKLPFPAGKFHPKFQKTGLEQVKAAESLNLSCKGLEKPKSPVFQFKRRHE